MEHRFNALRRRFRTLGIAGYIVSRPSNIRWLCGFTGSNGLLLVTGKSAHFITDGRYTNQAREQITGAHIHIYSGGASAADAFVRELKNNRQIHLRGRIGIEAQIMTVEMFQALRQAFPHSALVESSRVVEELAQVKDEIEIDAIRRAVKITDKVFKAVLERIKPGVRELDIAAEITYLHRQNGADRDSFETIVASGPRSALPHGIASARKLREGDFVTIDMGCQVDGYASDMTRTVVLGKAGDRQKEVYAAVFRAQERAAAAVKPGMRCADLDALARRDIADAGFGQFFTHGLGHGLGLEVHGLPVLSNQWKTRLAPGMVVTVEPGIYIDNFGGVRIEDDVLVTGDGGEILNRTPKKLLEL